jgi:hypothetical protein
MTTPNCLAEKSLFVAESGDFVTPAGSIHALIQIKAAADLEPQIVPIQPRETTMPKDVAIIVGAITAAFIFFAAALAWADHYSSGAAHRPGAAE